ncbi:Nucleic acid-binding, OB-fold [Sesbania bispinosa]|nr:Nucleic acid-binding, OB-fold [Sesbania bispinosa]
MDTHSFQSSENLGGLKLFSILNSLSHDLSDGYVILIDPKGNCFHLTLDAGSNRAQYITGVGKMFQFYGIFQPHKIELTYKGYGVFDYKIFNYLMLELEYPDLLRRSVIVLDSYSDEESESNGWKVILTKAVALTKNPLKVCRIKVRVIRQWRSANFKDSSHKPMIKMVVLDEEGGCIQCTVKSIHVYLFEGIVLEGNIYMLENVSVALNSAKFKPTIHEFRLFFKRETQVRMIEDSNIPMNGFSFVPFTDILNEKNDESRLVDIIGVVTGKGNTQTVECSQLLDANNVSVEEEFLHRCVYKSIVDLKEVTQGGNKNGHPEEIDAFLEKKFLFKVQVKMQDFESIVPSVISVSKLCFDENIIHAFIQKYKVDEFCFPQDDSELLSQFTEHSDLMKETFTASCDNVDDSGSPVLTPVGNKNENAIVALSPSIDTPLATSVPKPSFMTPSKDDINNWCAKPTMAVGDDVEMLATKLRKVVKEEKK